jgi:hypothetical protein
MTTPTATAGRGTGGKPINLAQLQGEIQAAGVSVSALGMHDDLVYRYDDAGVQTDFAAAVQPTVDQCIADHVAMRDKTDAEYSAEFQDPDTTVARKQEIRDITAGLLPREQVPMT